MATASWEVEIERAVRGSEARLRQAFSHLDSLASRVGSLEAARDQQAVQTALKSQAAQQQGARGNARGPLRTYAMKHEPIKEQCSDPRSNPAPYDPALKDPHNIPGSGLYAPLRSDTKPLIDLAAFARRLLNPDDLGHAVTKEVRDSARRALGMPEVREYDL